MRFLMVRASQQNSKVGAGSWGSFQLLKYKRNIRTHTKYQKERKKTFILVTNLCSLLPTIFFYQPPRDIISSLPVQVFSKPQALSFRPCGEWAAVKLFVQLCPPSIQIVRQIELEENPSQAQKPPQDHRPPVLSGRFKVSNWLSHDYLAQSLQLTASVQFRLCSESHWKKPDYGSFGWSL